MNVVSEAYTPKTFYSTLTPPQSCSSYQNKSLFPDMAVSLIQDDLVYLQKVWGSVATVDVSYEVPEQHAERVLSAYSKPKADFLEKKLELVS